jgi:hypothetical protein
MEKQPLLKQPASNAYLPSTYPLYPPSGANELNHSSGSFSFLFSFVFHPPVSLRMSNFLWLLLNRTFHGTLQISVGYNTTYFSKNKSQTFKKMWDPWRLYSLQLL